jgi:glycosyltransferase involved in cell wall biosynthesis
MDKLISVIIPVYNTASYLTRCVNSILSQTYKSIEIIMVNDGSTDNSDDIIKSLKAQNDNIKYVNIENNKGLSYARNIGIENAEGEYLGFVDSDDWIENNMYEKLINAIQTYNTKFSSALFYNAKVINGVMMRKHIYEMPDITYFDNAEDMLYHYISHHDIMVTNKLFSKSLFDSVRFPVGKVFEDTYIFHRLLNGEDTGVLLGNELYAHFLRNGSITRGSLNIHSFDYIEHIIDRYKYITEEYSSTLLEKLCRKYIFEALMDLTYALNPPMLDQESVMYKYFIDVYEYVFNSYSYFDCGLSKKQFEQCELLKSNVPEFMISRAFDTSGI